MRNIKPLFVWLILLVSVLGFESVAIAQICNGPLCASGTTLPQWIKCTVTNSGANLVVSGTGCMSATIAKAVALTQAIPILVLPANGYVEAFRIKTSTAFAGTLTLLAGLGNTATPALYIVSAISGYNLQTAPSVSNFTPTLPLIAGSDTTTATNVVLSLTSTVNNIASISGGVVDVWVLWSVLP